METNFTENLNETTLPTNFKVSAEVLDDSINLSLENQSSLETTNSSASGLQGIFNSTIEAASSTVHTIQAVTNGGFRLPPSTITSNFTDTRVDEGFNNSTETETDPVLLSNSAEKLVSNSSVEDVQLPEIPIIQSVIDLITSTLAPGTDLTNSSTTANDTIHGDIFNITINNATEKILPFLNANATMPNSTISPADVPEMLSTGSMICTIIPLSLISLIIIFGNLLVILAVFTQRSLRSPQNIYIVSLACADMTVGVLILPINIAYLVLNHWFMGSVLCELWLVTDVSLCTVSIFHLCAIAVDRYRAITDGINYVQKRNLKSVLWTILFIWILAFWIGSPPILGWKDIGEQGELLPLYYEHQCMLPTNPGYVFHLAAGALLFPLIVMGFIYGKIYFALREKFRARAKVQCMEMTSEHESSDLTSTLKRGSKRKPSEQISSFMINKQKFSLNRERKAARTLGIIMGAFIICWLPLGFINIITALVPREYNPSSTVFQVFNWLGYVNSGLNPIIYAVSNQEFQKGFKRLLHLDSLSLCGVNLL